MVLGRNHKSSKSHTDSEQTMLLSTQYKDPGLLQYCEEVQALFTVT